MEYNDRDLWGPPPTLPTPLLQPGCSFHARSPFPLDFIKCELFIQLLRTAGAEEEEDGRAGEREMVEGSSIPVREFSQPYHSPPRSPTLGSSLKASYTAIT